MIYFQLKKGSVSARIIEYQVQGEKVLIQGAS